MKFDPTRLEIFKNLFHSVAEEMGSALRRVAFSPNIKERRDYSCAVFDAKGEVLAMGDHMPVHLGSMPMSVAAAMHALTLDPGDIALLNDPYAGGTHLPDLTMVMPVYHPTRNQTALLCREPGPSRGYRRRTCRLDGARTRNIPGRLANPTRQDLKSRASGSRCDGIASRKRAHSARARRRPDGANRRLPHRRAPPARNHREVRPQGSGNLRTPPARLFRAHDARHASRNSQRAIPRSRLLGRRWDLPGAAAHRCYNHDRRIDCRQSISPAPRHNARAA